MTTRSRSEITCSICGDTKPIADFYTSVFSRCRECHKKAMRELRVAAHERVCAYDRARSKDPVRSKRVQESFRRRRQTIPSESVKYKARTRLNNALRDGRILKDRCAKCGGTVDVQAHHHDYSKPLDVVWLCFVCHRGDGHEQWVSDFIKQKIASGTPMGIGGRKKRSG